MSTLKVGTIQSTTGNTGLTIANDGTVLPKACAFQMKSTVAQSIANATEVQIAFGQTNFDTNSIVDLSNNRVVITTATAGIWDLRFVSRIANTNPYRHLSFIKKNGNNLAYHEANQYTQGTGAYQSVEVNCLANLANGDVLTFFMYHAYGSARNTEVGGTNDIDIRAEGFRIGTL